MCDEYDDARMKAFWRALAEEQRSDEALDKGDSEVIIKPIVIEPLERVTTKPKALTR